MKGFLSFLMLHLIGKQSMSGDDIRTELEKRKGTKPSPGTIYPVLKTLCENGWIEEVPSQGKEKKYQLTSSGKQELKNANKKFMCMFYDMK
ncbi:PadR family transcriptional regulator [Candidatus Woesearchaeota archaeon]|nr:PadR family transcriptional regulator [Candidatus Woesearchaeota archaeon]